MRTCDSELGKRTVSRDFVFAAGGSSADAEAPEMRVVSFFGSFGSAIQESLLRKKTRVTR